MTTTIYDLADKARKVTRSVVGRSAISTTTTDEYDYDHGLRQTNHYQQITGRTNRNRMSSLSYTIKDEVKERNIGYLLAANPLQSVDYTYNPRGWLTSINGILSNANVPQVKCGTTYAAVTPTTVSVGESSPDLFMEQLHYDNSWATQLGATAQKNGNIASIVYQTYGTQQQAYGYAYDEFDRLLTATHCLVADGATTATASSRYNEEVGYDYRGNIRRLSRQGLTSTCAIPHPGATGLQLLVPCPINK